jgi:amino acid permease
MYVVTIGLYVVTAILVSFCVSWDDPMLQSYNSPSGYVGASNSPFIIAMTRGGMGEKVANTYKALFFLSAVTTM